MDLSPKRTSFLDESSTPFLTPYDSPRRATHPADSPYPLRSTHHQYLHGGLLRGRDVFETLFSNNNSIPSLETEMFSKSIDLSPVKNSSMDRDKPFLEFLTPLSHDPSLKGADEELKRDEINSQKTGGLVSADVSSWEIRRHARPLDENRDPHTDAPTHPSPLIAQQAPENWMALKESNEKLNQENVALKEQLRATQTTIRGDLDPQVAVLQQNLEDELFAVQSAMNSLFAAQSQISQMTRPFKRDPPSQEHHEHPSNNMTDSLATQLITSERDLAAAMVTLNDRLFNLEQLIQRDAIAPLLSSRALTLVDHGSDMDVVHATVSSNTSVTETLPTPDSSLSQSLWLTHYALTTQKLAQMQSTLDRVEASKESLLFSRHRHTQQLDVLVRHLREAREENQQLEARLLTMSLSPNTQPHPSLDSAPLSSDIHVVHDEKCHQEILNQRENDALLAQLQQQHQEEMAVQQQRITDLENELSRQTASTLALQTDLQQLQLQLDLQHQQWSPLRAHVASLESVLQTAHLKLSHALQEDTPLSPSPSIDVLLEQDIDRLVEKQTQEKTWLINDHAAHVQQLTEQMKEQLAEHLQTVQTITTDHLHRDSEWQQERHQLQQERHQLQQKGDQLEQSLLALREEFRVKEQQWIADLAPFISLSTDTVTLPLIVTQLITQKQAHDQRIAELQTMLAHQRVRHEEWQLLQDNALRAATAQCTDMHARWIACDAELEAFRETQKVYEEREAAWQTLKASWDAERAEALNALTLLHAENETLQGDLSVLRRMEEDALSEREALREQQVQLAAVWQQQMEEKERAIRALHDQELAEMQRMIDDARAAAAAAVPLAVETPVETQRVSTVINDAVLDMTVIRRKWAEAAAKWQSVRQQWDTIEEDFREKKTRDETAISMDNRDFMASAHQFEDRMRAFRVVLQQAGR